MNKELLEEYADTLLGRDFCRPSKYGKPLYGKVENVSVMGKGFSETSKQVPIRGYTTKTRKVLTGEIYNRWSILVHTKEGQAYDYNELHFK